MRYCQLIAQKKPFQRQKRGYSSFRNNRPQVSWTLWIQPASQQVNQIVRPKAWEIEMDESYTQCPSTNGDGYRVLSQYSLLFLKYNEDEKHLVNGPRLESRNNREQFPIAYTGR